MLYLFLADGFEETEAIATLDVLRRGNIKTKTVGVGGEFIFGTHEIVVKADATEVDYSDIDGVILPGGMPGTLNLQKDEGVTKAVNYCMENGKLVAAICAAPMIIGEMGYLDGKKAVCFPGFEDSLGDAEIMPDGVVVDGNIITAMGAGRALEFGAAICDYISNEPGKGAKVLKKMMFPQPA